jgi:hypothetical protein
MKLLTFTLFLKHKGTFQIPLASFQKEKTMLGKSPLMIFFLVISLGLPLQGKTIEGVNESKCAFYLSACAIFQDEAPYLKKWIEFHRLMGVEHFYLYNNNSHDHFIEVLEPYVQAGIVEITDWPSSEDGDWTPYQKQAYNHCVHRCTGKTRWLAVLDIDEFMFPVEASNLKAFLQPYDSDKSIGGVMLFWQIYGTSGVEKVTENELLIEKLTMKAAWNHPWNQHVKTICKPHKVSTYQVHGAWYKKGYKDITTNGGGGPNQPIQLNRARINHYWTRDEHFFYTVKIPRRERLEKTHYSQDIINSFLNSFNQTTDLAIFRFIPQLKKRLQQHPEKFNP